MSYSQADQRKRVEILEEREGKGVSYYILSKRNLYLT
jgi:hypothetical protein